MVNKKQLKRQLLNARNELKEIKELVKKLEKINGEYKEELHKAKAKYAEACAQYQKYRAALLEAEGRVHEAEEAARIAQEQLAKANKELAKTNKELADTQKQLAKAEEKANEFDEMAKDITNRITALEESMDIIEDEIAEYGETATEKCMAIDDFNEMIETNDNPTVIKTLKNGRLDALRDKAEIEGKINTKRNLLEAKSKELKKLENAWDVISEYKK